MDRSLVTRLRSAVLESTGVTEAAARQAAAAGEAVHPAVDLYLEKVRNASYRIVDGDIDALRDQGFAEEEIFELTVAAALGTALQTFDTALRRMEA